MNRFLDDRAARRAARAAADGSAAAAAPKPGPARGPTVPDPVPPFRVRQLTIEDGLALATWSSPGAWHIEDALEAPEPDEGYWAVVDSADDLLGFCCLGAAARVPGRPPDEWLLDVAIGIRPQLAGRGWGGELGRAAVPTPARWPWTAGSGPPCPDWNEVGRHAARQAGFTSSPARSA